MLAISVLVAPADHGAGIEGMHGIGVSTPAAADVADATVGLDGLLHMIKVGRFTISLSMIVAAGMLVPIVLFVGRTIRLHGPEPIVQLHIAPMTTSFPMQIN